MKTTYVPRPVRERREKCNRWLLFFAVLLLVATAAFAIDKVRRQPSSSEPNVTVGAMAGKTDEEIQRALQSAQNEAMISYTVNSHPVFPDGASMGDWLLDCPKENFNKLRFVITQDSTGAVLYDSGPLEQGSYILEDYIQTDTPLAKGDYDCTVSINVLDPKTERVKGHVEVKIVLTVQA